MYFQEHFTMKSKVEEGKLLQPNLTYQARVTCLWTAGEKKRPG